MTHGYDARLQRKRKVTDIQNEPERTQPGRSATNAGPSNLGARSEQSNPPLKRRNTLHNPSPADLLNDYAIPSNTIFIPLAVDAPSVFSIKFITRAVSYLYWLSLAAVVQLFPELVSEPASADRLSDRHSNDSSNNEFPAQNPAQS